MRPAGVIGDVAADRARLLARRIGRVVVALRPDRPREVQVHQTRLDDGDLVVVVHLEDPVHPHEGDDDAPLRRQAPARQPGPRATGHERERLPVGEPDDRGDVLRGAREDDEVGEGAEEREAVGLVDEELFGI